MFRPREGILSGTRRPPSEPRPMETASQNDKPETFPRVLRYFTLDLNFISVRDYPKFIQAEIGI
tara:strand:- start:809 stop:1000 length:192 start_codon:yes stop_codon:yes gene_type:complete